MEFETAFQLVVTGISALIVAYGAKVISKEVDTLKSQVNSQKEILERTESYFKIIDITKIKEYADVIEQTATLKGQMALEVLNKQIAEKQAEKDALTQKHSLLEEQNKALETRKDVLESKLDGFESRMRNLEARTKYPEFFNATDLFASNNSSTTRGKVSLSQIVQDILCEYLEANYPITEPDPVYASASSIHTSAIPVLIEKDGLFKMQFQSHPKECSKIIEDWCVAYFGVRRIMNGKPPLSFPK